MGVIRFVRNVQDNSSESGFQFEFFCDRCGTGYQTTYTSATCNNLPDILNAAGSLLGGVFGAASQVSERMRETAWKKEKNAAFEKAIQEVKDYFFQCKTCSQWVDEACWNAGKHQCKPCTEEAEDALHTESADTVICSHCEVEVAAAKFCSDCGKPLKTRKTCKSCGAQTSGKFCPECGKKVS